MLTKNSIEERVKKVLHCPSLVDGIRKYVFYGAVAFAVACFSLAIVFFIRNATSPEFPSNVPFGDLNMLIQYSNWKASLVSNANFSAEFGMVFVVGALIARFMPRPSLPKQELGKATAGINREELGVTGARGMAAFYVFIAHFVYYSQYTPNLLTNVCVSGSTGVDFFFVLSAYLLSKKMLRGDYKSKVQYYARRIFRIWPTFYVALTVFFLLGYWKFEPLAYLFFSNYSTTTWVGLPVWTLMVEEAFYFVLPVWLLLFTKGRWKFAIVGVLAFEIVFRVLTINTPIASEYNWTIGARLFDYAIGTVLGLGVSVAALRMFSSKYLSLAIKIGIIASFLVLGEITGWTDEWFTPIAYSVIYYLVLCFFANSPFFTNKLSVFLGRISYGWYLYGYCLTYFFSKYYSTSHGWLTTYLTISSIEGVLIFGGSVAVSWFSYKYFEMPIIAFGKRLFGREQGELAEPIPVAVTLPEKLS